MRAEAELCRRVTPAFDVPPGRLWAGERPLAADQAAQHRGIQSGLDFALFVCSLVKYKGVNMETIIPLSELQSQAKKIVERVKNTRDTVIITQKGRPAALLVSYEDYEGIVATLEEISQPAWRAQLAETGRDSRVSKSIEREEFKLRRATCGTMRLNCSHRRKKS